MAIAIIGLSFPVASASASSNVTIGFVLMNSNTGTNAGAGNPITMREDAGSTQYNQTTNANGVVSFSVAPSYYFITSRCTVCNPIANQGDIAGTNYLVKVGNDGSVEVLSAADETMKKDSSGNWIISALPASTTQSGGPWSLMTQPSFRNTGYSPQQLFLLTNGKVFVQAKNGQGLTQWWLYSPDSSGNYQNGTWQQAANAPAGYNPQNFNGAVLHDGNFMMMGGEQNVDANGVMSEFTTNTGALYNVATNTWSTIAAPNNGQGDWNAIPDAPMVLLPNGQYMQGAGGSVYDGKGGFTIGKPNSGHDPSALYSFTSKSWAITGTNKVGSNFEGGYQLLQNGNVLSVASDNYGQRGVAGPAEVYNPTTGLWSSAGTTPSSLFFSETGATIGLPNGKVLGTGPAGNAALYDPTTTSWTAAPNLPKLKNGLQLSCSDNAAAILPSGNVLMAVSTFPQTPNGGASFMGPAIYVEYDVASNSWTTLPYDLSGIPSASEGVNGIFFLDLPNGQVMVIHDGVMELFTDTTAPNSSWLPVVSSVSSSTISPNTSYSVTGAQLSGLTQGTNWGDESMNATNYPLVRIVNDATKAVTYAMVTNVSSTSIAPNAPATLDFTLSASTQNGPSQLYVVASGVASAPKPLTVSGGAQLPQSSLSATAAKGISGTPLTLTSSGGSGSGAVSFATSTKGCSINGDQLTSTSAITCAVSAFKASDSIYNSATSSVVSIVMSAAPVTTTTTTTTPPKTVAKSTTITCVKGKLTKKVTGVNPKCPAGYTKK